jgi:hypothetical protein
MLPCAPYIKNFCQAIQLDIEADFGPDPSPQHDGVLKKQTEVRVTDVTSVKINLLDASDEFLEYNIEQQDEIIPVEYVSMSSVVIPESPDVTKAAKVFESSQISEIKSETALGTEESDECDIGGDIRRIIEDTQKEQEKLGAISKTTR